MLRVGHGPNYKTSGSRGEPPANVARMLSPSDRASLPPSIDMSWGAYQSLKEKVLGADWHRLVPEGQAKVKKHYTH